MSRVLLNNPQLSRKISREFIPFAGSVERLQPSRYGGKETPTSRWFQTHAKKALARFAPPGWWKNFKTYQGFYVLGEDGTAYSYKVVWKISAQDVIEELDRAQKSHRAEPPKKVKIPARQAGSRPLTPPPGTSILRVFGRIRPLPAGAPESNRGIGRDHMWITRSEVQEMLNKGRLPHSVIARMVRFQLLDNVRNVSPGFDEKEVKKADFNSELEGQQLKFRGDFESSGRTNEGKPFTMKGRITGRFTLDPQQKKIVHCRAFAKATASGESTAEAPSGAYPMVFAIVDAYDEVGYSVPPTTYGISPLFRDLYLDPKLPW